MMSIEKHFCVFYFLRLHLSKFCLLLVLYVISSQLIAVVLFGITNKNPLDVLIHTFTEMQCHRLCT